MWAVPALFSRPSDRWHGGRAEPLPQRSSRSAKTAAVGDGYHSPPISPAAVDADRLAGDETGLVGGEIGDHRGDLVGFAKAADRVALARSRKPVSRSSPYSRRLVLIAREVRIGPGQTALTVMPKGARSSASERVKPRIAAFEAA